MQLGLVLKRPSAGSLRGNATLSELETSAETVKSADDFCCSCDRRIALRNIRVNLKLVYDRYDVILYGYIARIVQC